MNSTWIIVIILSYVIVAVIVAYLAYANKKKTQKLINEYAYIDEVIGYSNYSKFEKDARTMLKYKDRKLCVGYVDVNNFKTINDFYGREQGDEVLKIVANRIHDLVIPDGVFARRFADRFVFLVSFLDIKSFEYAIETYMSDIEIVIPGINEAIKINCKCGIYQVENFDEDINEMVDKAAIAAKISKNSISKKVTILDTNVSANIAKDQMITYRMDKAFEENEFIVFIQPKISFVTGKIVGGEALVRWESKTDGMVLPGDFIPLFERNGFVTKIDFYVLERICRMLKERDDNGKFNVPISVNQSRLHVYDSKYINKLIEMLEKYNVNKENIIFELTESAFTENEDDMAELVARMSHLGYKVSMDDFGCGYSSLNMLNSLPISELKLDKSFLDDKSPRSRFVIKSIVNLAHGLNISTVCEGVETEEQATFLRDIGCDIAQGFLYAKPMPLDEFEAMMNAQYGSVYGKTLIRKHEN